MRTFWTMLLPLLALTACAAPTRRYTFEHRQMGTAFRLVLYGADAKSATDAAAAAWRRVDELNAIMSDWDSRSELSKLSATAGSGRAVRLSEPLWAILSRSKQWSVRTGGAFDVTVGPAVHLWRRYRRQHKMPPPARLDEARRAIGHEKLLLDPINRTATLTAPNMRLDLGAIAKGRAADEALAIVQRAGFASALVDAGGDLVLGAAPPGRTGWRVALIAMVGCTLHGILGEWHQGFVPGRSPSVGDGIADGVGAVIAAAAWYWLFVRIAARKAARN